MAHAPDGTPSKGLSRQRRQLLQTLGAIGVFGTAGCADSAEDADADDEPADDQSTDAVDDGTDHVTDDDRDDGDDDPATAEYADANHDHSGEFGAATRLGEAAPVESITVDDLRTKTGPVIDVRAHGVVGDGSTDDSAAFQEAIDAATPHGVLYIPYDVRMRLESPVEMDFGGTPEQHRFAFICDGMITPAPGIGDAITIRNSAQIYVRVRVQGGGRDVETDTAVHLVGGRNQYVEGWGTNYDGTVYTFTNAATYSVGFLRTRGCGQSLAVYDASPMGEFRDGFDTAPIRAPEFHNTSDIQINQYENFVATNCEQGLLFDDCLSVFADKVAVGGIAEVPIMEIRDTWNANFSGVHLGGAPDRGAVIENTHDASFNIFSHVNNVGVEYRGSASARNRFAFNALSVEDTAFRIADDVTGGYHYVTGNISAGANIGLDVQTSDADIRLDGLEIRGNDLDLRLPSENEVHLHNSVIGSMQGWPKTTNHVGEERSAGSEPDGEQWEVGEVVAFEDTGGGDSGLYLKLPDGSWGRIGDI